MYESDRSYKNKKVMSIGVISELTGLSERKIRYYEERKLIFPDRSKKGTRKYSFTDVETLMEIAEQREEGVQTFEIHEEMKKKSKHAKNMRDQMIRGQLNAHFNMRK